MIELSLARPTSPLNEPTFEGIIKVLLPKDNPQVMDGAGVELHTEDDVSGWAPELLVVALQLSEKESRAHQAPTGGKPGPRELLHQLQDWAPKAHPKPSEGEVTNTNRISEPLGKLLEEQRVGGQSYPMGTKLPLKNFLHTDQSGKSRSGFKLMGEGLKLESRESLSPVRSQEVRAPTGRHFPGAIPELEVSPAEGASNSEAEECSSIVRGYKALQEP